MLLFPHHLHYVAGEQVFVGGLPRHSTSKDIWSALQRHTPSVTEVHLVLEANESGSSKDVYRISDVQVSADAPTGFHNEPLTQESCPSRFDRASRRLAELSCRCCTETEVPQADCNQSTGRPGGAEFGLLLSRIETKNNIRLINKTRRVSDLAQS
ncbi:unnamed protein product [Protopolystoma xenopodis]|uniref:RRM domain-containing protein n=1 Tax=Protopolystoma xenopodis TaxID=117903 RepID=A0A3S5C3V2_9PLAT|nr:unnamed protein product [Protopolystoma xenopodis]